MRILEPIIGVFLVMNMAWSSQLGCVNDDALHTLRSNELQTLVAADQQDRESDWGALSLQEIEQIKENDLNRRKRVGEIFGEGCITTDKDYLAAFLIYQHGDIPDHYFQAFIFAHRAAELQQKTGSPSAAAAIDRYLISIGHKQLYGTQYFSDSLAGCLCMESIEESFPDTLRRSHTHHTLQEYYDVLAMLNQGKQCFNQDCEKQLKPSPQGIVPGLW